MKLSLPPPHTHNTFLVSIARKGVTCMDQVQITSSLPRPVVNIYTLFQRLIYNTLCSSDIIIFFCWIIFPLTELIKSYLKVNTVKTSYEVKENEVWRVIAERQRPENWNRSLQPQNQVNEAARKLFLELKPCSQVCSVEQRLVMLRLRGSCSAPGAASSLPRLVLMILVDFCLPALESYKRLSSHGSKF